MTCRHAVLICFCSALALSGMHCGRIPDDRSIRTVPLSDVTIEDDFWRPRLEINHAVTLPHAFRQLESSGCLDNFRKAAGRMAGGFEGRRTNDSDLYKVLEAAAHTLASSPDSSLEARCDSLILLIEAAQEDDGYIYTARSIDPDHPAPGAGSRRWVHVQGSHELYNMGHLMEAAAAYYQATGKERLLNVAALSADLLCREFGLGKRHDAPGHQEVERGLIRLFRVTGRNHYLDLAKFFLDQRGQLHDSVPYESRTAFAIYNGLAYRQDHKPVLQQESVTGHSVRAVYMASAMAEIGRLRGDAVFSQASQRLWQDMIQGKIYVTGGIGSVPRWEGFGPAYDLPNRTAYSETCASVGLMQWAHDLFSQNGRAEAMDIFEKTLYNAFLAGVSQTGLDFFYSNPLEADAEVRRQPWFDCACCPPNASRFLAALPASIYSQQGDRLYCNLYVASSAVFTLPSGRTVHFRQSGQYPWSGKIVIELEPDVSESFEVALRLPGWTQGQALDSDLYQFEDTGPDAYTCYINGDQADVHPVNGYLILKRQWWRNDRIELDLPMPVRQIRSHVKVTANSGCAAFQRGPLIYCVEEADNHAVSELAVNAAGTWHKMWRPELLGGTMTITGSGLWRDEPVDLTLIPYHLWAHRQAGGMAVWLPVSNLPAGSAADSDDGAASETTLWDR